jgi:hypothetical protein
MPMTSANTTTTSAKLDNATLRERILTSGAGNARGSLTKVASQYRDFIHLLTRTRSDCGADDNSKSKSAAAATNLKTELLLHDVEIRKLILSSKATHGNSSTYTSTLTRMQSSLSSIQQDIETLTSTYLQQGQIHSRRKEYNALAKLANEQHPPIHKTKNELEQIQEQIQLVGREVNEATLKLTVREKQLRLLMSCLGDLKASLNEEEMIVTQQQKKTVVMTTMENKEEEEEGMVEEKKRKGEEAAPPANKRKRDTTTSSSSGSGNDDSVAL